MEVRKLWSFSEVEFLKETLLQQVTPGSVHTWKIHSCKSYRWAPLTWKTRKVEEAGEGKETWFCSCPEHRGLPGSEFPANCTSCSLEELERGS